MTKRFTYEYDEYNGNLFDNKMNTFYHIEDSDENIEVLCDRLNWLVKENEQLKHRLAISEKANFISALEKENKQLKEQLSEAKADEKQLGISFMGYKMKLIEVLQKKYDKVKGKTLYADVYTEIAEEMGVDLE